MSLYRDVSQQPFVYDTKWRAAFLFPLRLYFSNNISQTSVVNLVNYIKTTYYWN